MIFSRRCLFFSALLIAVFFAAFGLLPRLRAERNNKTIAFVMEYKDITSLSSQSGSEPLEVWREVASKGVQGITVMEYTGEDLMNLSPMPLKFGAAGSLGVDGGNILADNAVLIIDSKSPYVKPIYDYLKIKIPAVRAVSTAFGETILVLPGTTDLFRQSAFIPDFPGLELCSENNIPILFRPGPCLVSDGEQVAMSLSWLANRYPIKNLVPSGAIMAGYPQLAPIAKVLKEEGISLAQVEFVKQIGVAGMVSMMAPEVIPLHSLTKEEILSRRMSRPQIRERLVRAVHERSVRLLLMRPYDLQMGDRLAVLTEDLEAVKSDVQALGYSFGWPKTLPVWRAQFAGAIACALSFLFCLWFYFARLLGVEEERAALREIVSLSLLSFFGAVLMLKATPIASIAGGFGTAFVATEAALCAMSYYKKPMKGLILGLFIVIVGGLSTAAFYGTTAAALRLTPFSGVKLTLLLPPLLILLHDFRRRVHPESISEIMLRPAIWAELALVGAMLLALLVMGLRSDNVSSVPGWETAFRDFMERLLLVRPRTKEFTIGYPALILYYYFMRMGWAARYREAIRIAASVAFSSAVNTFCHFHTALVLSLLRVTLGWGAGIIVGVVAVALLHYAAVPLWKKGFRETIRYRPRDLFRGAARCRDLCRKWRWADFNKRGFFSKTRRFDVVLAGYYGFGNLGDELLAESAVALLQKNGIERGRIAILSATPADTSKQMGISAFDRWKLFEVIKVIKSSRSLLLGGGGLFQDATSVRSSLYYWGLVSIARLCGAVPWAVGQSIGPLRSSFASKLTKNAMAACAFRGVRDERSLDYLRSWGLAGRLSPDLVVGLDVKRTPGTGNLLLFNLRPGYDALAEQAARAAQKAAKDGQRKIRCIAFSKEDEITIRYYIDKKIIKSLESNEITLLQTAQDFEKAAADCSHAIGMRLHFVVLSFLSGLRVSAVPYDPKVESFSLRYNIPVIDKHSGKITFSEPRSGEERGSEAEMLLHLLRDGVADVLGETQWMVPK